MHALVRESRTSQFIDKSVPVVIALSTWNTVRKNSCGATITPVALDTRNSHSTFTLPCSPVALKRY